jgi:integrase
MKPKKKPSPSILVKPSASISFYFQKPSDKNDLGKVYANITCNKTKSAFYTGTKVKYDEFYEGKVLLKTKASRVAHQDIEDMRNLVDNMDIKSHHNASIIKSIIAGTYEDGMFEATIINAVEYGYKESCRFITESSSRTYNGALDKFTSWMRNYYTFNDVSLSKVSTDITNKFLDSMLEEGISLPHARQVLCWLSGFYKTYATDHPDVISAQDPFELTRRKFSRHSRKTNMDRKRNIFDSHLNEVLIKDIEAFEFKGHTRHSSNRWRLMVLWQIYTGFAFDDLGNPDWKILDVGDEKIIELYRGKSKNRCPIPLTGEAQSVIDRLEEESFDGKLFPVGIFIKNGETNLRERRMYYDRYDRFLKKFSKQIGVPLRTHLFRHTFGMLMINRGISLSSVAEMMGHSSSATTEAFYARPSDAHIIREVLGKERALG